MMTVADTKAFFSIVTAQGLVASCVSSTPEVTFANVYFPSGLAVATHSTPLGERWSSETVPSSMAGGPFPMLDVLSFLSWIAARGATHLTFSARLKTYTVLRYASVRVDVGNGEVFFVGWGLGD